MHTKHDHHLVVKSHEYGKEFIHEKDRLHHVRQNQNHKHKLDHRTHKDSYNPNKLGSLQDQVNENAENFGDSF
ncbi:MAG TPA: hypothetical protein VH415_02405 [Nitrososphaeraceae archaeon]